MVAQQAHQKYARLREMNVSADDEVRFPHLAPAHSPWNASIYASRNAFYNWQIWY